jgi:hypothetical protein
MLEENVEAHLKVVNERLHALLHGSPWRRDKFVVVHFNSTCWYFVETLPRKEIDQQRKRMRMTGESRPG